MQILAIGRSVSALALVGSVETLESAGQKGTFIRVGMEAAFPGDAIGQMSGRPDQWGADIPHASARKMGLLAAAVKPCLVTMKSLSATTDASGERSDQDSESFR
jgi:hypothetical protein